MRVAAGLELAENPSDFILEAAENLIASRRVLSWTYIWAFFEHDDGIRELFEHSQAELERFTERLSKLTEGKTAEELLERKVEIISLTSVLFKFRASIEFYERPGGQRLAPSSKQPPAAPEKEGAKALPKAADAAAADVAPRAAGGKKAGGGKPKVGAKKKPGAATGRGEGMQHPPEHTKPKMWR